MSPLPPSPKTRAKMPTWYSSFPQLQKEDGTWIDSVVEHSIELLTMCDGRQHCTKNTPRNLVTKKETSSCNYARLHDEFLESLLQQQARLQQDQPLDGDSASWSSSLPCLSRESSVLTLSSVSSCTADATTSSSSENDQRRRPVRLSRRRQHVSSPVRSRMMQPHKLRQVANVDAMMQKETKPKPNSLLSQLSLSEYPDPSTYLHEDCILQKDKGRGEEPGSDVCARGKVACLKKVQQKMALLTQVAFNDEVSRKRSSPDMKRKMARITEETASYVETRSVIALKMGFLSMQYGLLLRWDYRQSGKICLVVLRKMCHESFYKRSPVRASYLARPPPEWLTLGGNHAVIHCGDGTEVALMDAPYRVERPELFEPSRLLARVTRVEGLDPSTQWFLKISWREEEYKSVLLYNEEKSYWTSKEPFEWEVPLLQDDDCLQVALLEQKRPSRVRRKERMSSRLSLAFLDSSSRISERKLLCVADGGYRISLGIYYQSDYAYWLYQELEARKREEVTGFVWKMPLVSKRELEEEEVDYWAMCCVC